MTTMNNYKDNTTNAKPQRVGLVFLNLKDEYYQEELSELVRTANGEVVLVVNQNRQSIDNATLVGSGKVEEIAELVKAQEIQVLVFNEELSPIQQRNIEDAVNCLVIDRTSLILDIFALHAVTAEGKIQVELAQLEYELPRLRSEKGKLSRQGGGIGTRGPGETKLETDKRRIRERIATLKERLREIEKRRMVTRGARERNEVPIVALVGYTNAGKSTLFNALSNSSVLTENKLFATLETTSRRITLPSGIICLLTDTVGFIRKLPHKLVEAFKSTLEETKYADILLNVCDCAAKEVNEHIAVTSQLLDELAVTGERLVVYNKCDLLTNNNVLLQDSICVSAIKRTGIDALLSTVDNMLSKRYCRLRVTVDYASLDKALAIAKAYAVTCNTSYDESTASLEILIDRKYISNFTEYSILLL